MKLADVDQALNDIKKSLERDGNLAEAQVINGEIHEAVGLFDQALISYRKAVELDPMLSKAWSGIERLDVNVSSLSAKAKPTSRVADPIDHWQIQKVGQQYFASSQKYKGVRVPLEMYGEEEPQLLEWSSLKKTYRGIGLLRYYAGDSNGRLRNEYIAIVDFRKRKVASIEPFRWGERLANWNWKNGTLVVTDPDGAANEIVLRKKRVSRPQPYAANWWWGGSNYQKSKRTSRSKAKKKQWQKSILDSLLN